MLTSAGGACGEVACAGWLAAIASMVGFGSFGAPIKSEAARRLDIDPLVFQTYKTAMCFITSWLALLVGIVPQFTFSPWGIVSGLFWVPGGVAAIAAVKLAGLAIAMAVGNSLIVLVSFTWGILIFQETVNSVFGACVGTLMLIIGFLGMTYYSTLEAELQEKEEYLKATTNACNAVENHDGIELRESLANNSTMRPTLRQRGSVELSYNSVEKNVLISQDNASPIVLWGRSVSRTRLGIGLAAFNGIWGGSQLVPMKFCPGDTAGVGYLMSFSIGATLVTLSLWAIRFLYHFSKLGSAQAAWFALPSFYLKDMWLPGGLSGLLWSFGNFFSFISVYYLGHGIGYSVTQAAMLVSGLLGIFYFREIKGAANISKWFLSAILTVCGILMLSYEKHGHKK